MSEKPCKEEVPQAPEGREPYEPPSIQSVRLSEDAAESLT